MITNRGAQRQALAAGMVAGSPMLAFVALGLPAGAIGLAGPSMRVSVGAPLAGLGVLIAAWTAAYFIVSAASGPLSTRLKLPLLLGVATAVATAGTMGFAVAPSLWIMTVASLMVGAGSGLIDATVNTRIALTRGVRFMGWLHASWAVGAAIGPELVVVSLKLSGSWRPAFVVMAALYAVVGGLIAWRRHDWESGEIRRDPSIPAESGVPGARWWILPLLIGLFLLGSGVEGTTGDWSYTELTAHRLLSSGTAGVSVSLFWIGLACGRMALGMYGDRVAAPRLLDVSVIAILLSAAGFWLAPPIIAGFIALPLLGLGVSVIFPLLVSLTPARVGRGMTAHAVGYELAAGTLGAGGFPAVVGLILQASGPGALGPAISALAVGLLLLHVATRVDESRH